MVYQIPFHLQLVISTANGIVVDIQYSL